MHHYIAFSIRYTPYVCAEEKQSLRNKKGKNKTQFLLKCIVIDFKKSLKKNPNK